MYRCLCALLDLMFVHFNDLLIFEVTPRCLSCTTHGQDQIFQHFNQILNLDYTLRQFSLAAWCDCFSFVSHCLSNICGVNIKVPT